MSQSIKEIYEQHYSGLVDKLPMKDAKFIAALTSAGFFIGDLKNEVDEQLTQAKRASHFLDSAILPSLKDDDDLDPLYNLLKVMEDHGGVVKRLAKTIKTAILRTENGSSSPEDGMYNNKILQFKNSQKCKCCQENAN